MQSSKDFEVLYMQMWFEEKLGQVTSVSTPIPDAIVFANITLLPELVPSGGQASLL